MMQAVFLHPLCHPGLKRALSAFAQEYVITVIARYLIKSDII